MKNAFNGNRLSREINLFSATVLVIANMVGTGIFTTSGFIMSELGDPYALLLCWLGGGLFALCGALCYGELGARFPKAGGEYVFLRESFGKPVGFLSGWISLFVGFSAPIAAASIAFTTYFFQAFSIPAGSSIELTVFKIPVLTISPSTIVAVGIICLFTLIHYHSLRIGNRVQNLLTLFKVLLMVVFLVAGFSAGNGSFDHFQITGSILSSLSSEKFAVSLIFISFAYSGWNAAAYMGDEIIDPQKNIPRALFIGTAIVTLIYLLLNLLYIYAIPPEQMAGVMEIGGKAAIYLFGEEISRLFSGAVALGILSVLSAMVVTGPRIYYAMSKDSVFLPVFGKLNPAHKTPASSIFLQAGIALFMVLSSSFESLLIYIGFTLALFALLTVVGLMKIRRDSSSDQNGYEDGSQKGYKTWGYPVTPVFFILCNLWIIFFSIKSRPFTALIGLATIGSGIIAYTVFNRSYDLNRSEDMAEVKVRM